MSTVSRAVGRAVDTYLSLLVRDDLTILRNSSSCTMSIYWESVSVDHKAVQRFPLEHLKLIRGEGLQARAGVSC